MNAAYPPATSERPQPASTIEPCKPHSVVACLDCHAAYIACENSMNQKNPAPDASEPMVPNGHTETIFLGGSSTPYTNSIIYPTPAHDVVTGDPIEVVHVNDVRYMELTQATVRANLEREREYYRDKWVRVERELADVRQHLLAKCETAWARADEATARAIRAEAASSETGISGAHISIPTDTMEQEFAKAERKGYANGYATGIETAAQTCDALYKCTPEGGTQEWRSAVNHGALECAKRIRTIKGKS